MAEIPIERKKASAWPWILLVLLVLALLAWWLFARAGNNTVATATTPATMVADSAAIAANPAMADTGIGGAASATALGTMPAGTASTTSNTAAGMTGVAMPGNLPASVSTPVRDYLTYVQSNRASAAAGPNHDYTAGGIRRLAAALKAIAVSDTLRGAALKPQITALDTRANELQRNSQSSQHANYTRDAFVAAADLMGAIQRQRFPSLQSTVVQVQQAATAINPSTPLLDQTAAVQKFFDSAATALRSMAPTT